ncbi:hypothetical protein L9F63_027965, partial [Diploptera punctata]
MTVFEIAISWKHESYEQLINHLRVNSHASCYASAMSPPVAQQIISAMKIIMGEDGTLEGKRRILQLARNTRYFRQRLKTDRNRNW